MATATAYSSPVCERQNRLSHERFSAVHHPEPKPGARDSLRATCPFCEQPLSHSRATVFPVLARSVQQLLVTLWTIACAVFRIARLVIAAALCLVGLIGLCCRTVGLKIAHRDDRRLLAGCRRPPRCS